MRKVTLRFSTLTDMLDFESVVITHGHQKDHQGLTISGFFEDAEIELAQTRYNVVVIEEVAD